LPFSPRDVGARQKKRFPGKEVEPGNQCRSLHSGRGSHRVEAIECIRVVLSNTIIIISKYSIKFKVFTQREQKSLALDLEILYMCVV
jgi:hypothetical protein